MKTFTAGDHSLLKPNLSARSEQYMSLWATPPTKKQNVLTGAHRGALVPPSLYTALSQGFCQNGVGWGYICSGNMFCFVFSLPNPGF